MGRWPNVVRWLRHVEAMPRHLPVYADAAREVVSFEDYFGIVPPG